VAELDPTLIQAACCDDASAWDQLIQRYQLPLFTFAAELLRDRTAALDIVQETFTSAVANIGGLRDQTKFGSWLFGIAHQRCAQQFRRQQRVDALFTEMAPDGDDPNDVTPDPCAALLQKEQAETVLALVDRLPVPQKSALLLHVLEGFSIDEIALISRVPVGTVKSRLHYAKRMLRQLPCLCAARTQRV
jgi:RNA polymerase sigma-70 factor (ECF subfamily)